MAFHGTVAEYQEAVIASLKADNEQLQQRLHEAVEALRPFAAIEHIETWATIDGIDYFVGNIPNGPAGCDVQRAIDIVTQAERGQAQSEGEESGG